MSIEKCFPGKKIGTTNYGEKQKSALQAYAEAWDEYVGLLERKSMHNGLNDSPSSPGNRDADAARKDGAGTDIRSRRPRGYSGIGTVACPSP